jgi:hypothetical protein
VGPLGRLLWAHDPHRRRRSVNALMRAGPYDVECTYAPKTARPRRNAPRRHRRGDRMSAFTSAPGHLSDPARSLTGVRESLIRGHGLSAAQLTDKEYRAAGMPPLNRCRAEKGPDGQITWAIYRPSVQPSSKKYSDFQKPQISPYIRRLVPTRGALRGRHGRWARDAVDVEVPLTNGTDADGEVVWS